MTTPIDAEMAKDILTWMGVANQLFTARANQIFGPYDLPLPQFSVLNHFTRRVDESGTTVTRLAAAFQANQPTMTKLVQSLVGKGYLDVTPDAEDGRIKLLTLSAAGRAAHQGAIQLIAPHVGMIFADWPEEDIESLHRLLFKLKSWLDDNRSTMPEESDA